MKRRVANEGGIKKGKVRESVRERKRERKGEEEEWKEWKEEEEGEEWKGEVEGRGRREGEGKECKRKGNVILLTTRKRIINQMSHQMIHNRNYHCTPTPSSIRFHRR